MNSLGFRRCVRALDDKDPGVRQSAVKNLGIMGDPRAVEPLADTLMDEDWGVRLYVVMALGIIGGQEALEPLNRALQDVDASIRACAVDALGNIGDQAVEPLIKALSDEDAFVRRAAAEALGNIEDPQAMGPLRRALKDADWSVHKEAVEALEKLSSPQAAEHLAQAPEKKDVGSVGRKHQQVNGEIAYYGLVDWWMGSFTEEERSFIENTYSPAGIQQENQLTTGKIEYSTQSVLGFLWGLATWFKKPDDRYLALRILEYAEETMGCLSQLALEEGEGCLARNDRGTSILDAHFVYLGLIRTHYKDRDNISGALDKAIEACEKQIRIAPQAARAFKAEYQKTSIPQHTGFEQLAIIRDKQGDYAAAIQLCEEAKAQGWAGEWDKRIVRYSKKADKC